ncbi:NAD-dependent epimerase/dehydratase family protein [Pacificibacter sp.]|uniref:NAD-dependent epimerase/dehydratase family protein n=1 Tax=Pacificibacter sp. TaxID=1917866 RepID=UPI0032199E0D
MKENVILVGASGRVGCMVAPAMHVVLQGRAQGDPTDAQHLNWDPLSGARALRDWIQRYGSVKTMLVLAGVTPGEGRDLSLNTAIADACLQAAKEAGIARVLLASTSAVYGLGDGQPFAETAPCNPVNDYGRAKLVMEQACDAWRSNTLEICCLRIGNVAGADALLLNIARSQAGAPVTIDTFEDARGPLRSYIGPASLASVLETLAHHPAALPPCLNIAAPEAIAMEALADAAEHPWTPRAGANEAFQKILLDCRLLCTLHSFTPSDSRPAVMITQWKSTLSK